MFYDFIVENKQKIQSIKAEQVALVFKVDQALKSDFKFMESLYLSHSTQSAKKDRNYLISYSTAARQETYPKLLILCRCGREQSSAKVYNCMICKETYCDYCCLSDVYA